MKNFESNNSFLHLKCPSYKVLMVISTYICFKKGKTFHFFQKTQKGTHNTVKVRTFFSIFHVIQYSCVTFIVAYGILFCQYLKIEDV